MSGEGIFTCVLSYFWGTSPQRNLNLNSDKALFVLDSTDPTHLGFITCKTEVINAVPQASMQLTGGGPSTGMWTWQPSLGPWQIGHAVVSARVPCESGDSGTGCSGPHSNAGPHPWCAPVASRP